MTRPMVLLCTGLLIVWAELALWALAARMPDDVLTAFAWGCLWPAAREGVRTVLGSGGTGSSSGSSPPPSPPPSGSPSPPEGEPGEHGS
jgi:hypothetical protein